MLKSFPLFYIVHALKKNFVEVFSYQNFYYLKKSQKLSF